MENTGWDWIQMFGQRKVSDSWHHEPLDGIGSFIIKVLEITQNPDILLYKPRMHKQALRPLFCLHFSVAYTIEQTLVVT